MEVWQSEVPKYRHLILVKSSHQVAAEYLEEASVGHDFDLGLADIVPPTCFSRTTLAGSEE